MHTDGVAFLIAVLLIAGLLIVFWRLVVVVIVTGVLAVFLVGLAEVVRLRGGR
jgi:hypothetical protein